MKIDPCLLGTKGPERLIIPCLQPTPIPKEGTPQEKPDKPAK
jgi:hypothetical protein